MRLFTFLRHLFLVLVHTTSDIQASSRQTIIVGAGLSSRMVHI